MAFVNRSDRVLDMSNQDTGDVGPGQYLPQDLIKKKSPSKIPFNSNTYRKV
jgi:hypothetical protein